MMDCIHRFSGSSKSSCLGGHKVFIRYGQNAGEIAAKAALSGKTQAESLAIYEKRWRGETDAKIRSALRVQRRWLQFSDEEWDKELESIRTLNDAELVQFMKADFGSRYAARMALRHPLFTLRQVYHMVKKI